MNTLMILSEGGADTSLVWLLYAGLGLFFAAIIVGWLASSAKREAPEIHAETKKPKSKK